MNAIQKFIDKHSRLKVIQICLRNSGDESFQKRVLCNEPLTVSLNCNEEIDSVAGIGSILYYISSGKKGRGFFAEYRRILDYLYFADLWGFTPYIEWNKQFSYSEDELINGVDNPFEYYFKQPCVTKDECLNYKYFVNSRECELELAASLKPRNGYAISNEYIDVMARIAKKYIRLNSFTYNYLSEEITRILNNKKTLGVHVRLTDFKQNYFGHPVCITADKHLAYAKQAMESGEYEQIFVATDDSSTINLFKAEFGGKMVYYDDVVRSDGDISIAFIEYEREHHHYMLGLEVLRDMYTLAMCNGLIAGKSQVSICALIENRNHKVYEYVEILDDGYNTNKEHYYDPSIN